MASVGLTVVHAPNKSAVTSQFDAQRRLSNAYNTDYAPDGAWTDSICQWMAKDSNRFPAFPLLVLANCDDKPADKQP